MNRLLLDDPPPLSLPDLSRPVTCPGCGGHAARLLPVPEIVVWECLTCGVAYPGEEVK